MKKYYEKPAILFENFAASVNIAAGCEVKFDGHSQGQCAYKVTDEFLGTSYLFTSDVAACITKEQSGVYNGICYHTPIDTNNLFNS